jgi:precorrin-6A/cobalt-precorrin-6A reductase
MAKRILVLGGTTEARALAAALARRPDLSVTVSLAGRTEHVVEQGVPTRIGGFGGAEGLAAWLRQERIDALIDATHPYAVQISRNAAAAVAITGTPFLALHRAPWQRVAGDMWTEAAGEVEAAAALGTEPRRVFLALGRKELAPFAVAPQHFYLVRSVDPVEPPLAVSDAVYVLERGPFSEAADRALMEAHRIDRLVCRNSGGDAAYGKIAAARALRIPVILIARPALPDAASVATSVGVAIAWVDHALALAAARGE